MPAVDFLHLMQSYRSQAFLSKWGLPAIATNAGKCTALKISLQKTLVCCTELYFTAQLDVQLQYRHVPVIPFPWYLILISPSFHSSSLLASNCSLSKFHHDLLICHTEELNDHD